MRATVMARSRQVLSRAGPSTRMRHDQMTTSICQPKRRETTAPIQSTYFTRRAQSSKATDSESTTSTRPCPKCSAPLPLPQSPCPKCSQIIPLASDLTYHSLLFLSSPNDNKSISDELASLPAYGFDLDARDVRSRMLNRQKDLHPDRYSGAQEGLARELSGRVNEAYAILSDPLKRAEYILSLHDLATGESDSLTDPGLLAEILEAREDLDSAESQEEVDELRKVNHEKVEQTIKSIKDAFSEVPPNLTAVKILAVQLKYWTGLEEAAKEWAPR